MIVRRVLGVVLVAVGVAGCSGSGGTSSSPPPSTAAPVAAGAGVCGYLTQSDVHRFGPHVSFPGTAGRDYDFGPSCDYGGAVFTLVEPDVSTAAFTSDTTKQVAGIGEHAYYGAQFHWLRVAAGRTRFELRCRLCDDPELPTLSAIARSLVPRLPQ